VEPMRSQNITLSGRRSAVVSAGARFPVGLLCGPASTVGVPSRRNAAIASSSWRRWPTEVTPKIPEVVGRQIGQELDTDVILAECRLVSFQPHVSQPVRDVHRRSLVQLNRIKAWLCQPRPVQETQSTCGPAPHRSRQFLQQRLRVLEVRCVETLGEPVVDRGEQIAGIDSLALVAPKLSKPGRSQ
jgi:hypothetical protein